MIDRRCETATVDEVPVIACNPGAFRSAPICIINLVLAGQWKIAVLESRHFTYSVRQ